MKVSILALSLLGAPRYRYNKGFKFITPGESIIDGAGIHRLGEQKRMVLEENIAGGIIGKLEVNLALVGILDHVQVDVHVSVTEAIGPRVVVRGAVCGGQFVHVDETAHQLLASVYLQHPVRAGPVLDGPAKLVLGLLGAGTQHQ